MGMAAELFRRYSAAIAEQLSALRAGDGSSARTADKVQSWGVVLLHGGAAVGLQLLPCSAMALPLRAAFMHWGP